MATNKVTKQGQSSEEEFKRIYAGYFNSDASNSASESEKQQLDSLIGKIEQVFGICPQESTQEVFPNPGMEQEMLSLLTLKTGFSSPRLEKIFDYYRRIKIAQLIARMVGVDAEKMDELYIEDLKIHFKQLIDKYASLLKEYKKQHELDMELWHIEIVVNAVEFAENGESNEFLHELLKIPEKDSKREQVVKAVFQKIQDGFKNNMHKTLVPVMRFNYDLSKLIQKLPNLADKKMIAVALEEHNKEIHKIIESNKPKPIHTLLSAVFSKYPNGITVDMFRKNLKGLAPDEIAEVRNAIVASSKNDNYMISRLTDIDSHLQSRLVVSASESKFITPFDLDMKPRPSSKER